MKLLTYCVLSINLLCFQALALSPQDVVSSSFKHAPQVLEALQKALEKENKVVESSGAFDVKLKSKMNLRTDGFYTGDIYRAEVEKAMPFANSKIYGGGRQSFGTFPSYEGKFKTQSSGEIFAGISISLLRDFAIDANRYALGQNKQNFKQAQINIDQVKITVQTLALKAYWTWVIKGYEAKVFQNIFDLARSRARQINRRIKAGDLARIYGVENDQYIKKWEVEWLRSNMEFQKAAYYLSLFYRDNNGAPKTLTGIALPDLSNETLFKVPNNEQFYTRALKKNLSLKTLSSQREQAKLDMKIGRNALLPKIDLMFELSEDRGDGAADLNQYENRFKLNFEIPIQTRKGRGKLRAGKAKNEALKNKQRWTSDKILIDTKSLTLKLNTYSDLYKVTSEQIDLAKQLSQAERKKFFRGASDLILVNIRDENLAQAQIKNLSSRLKYQFVDAELKELTVDFVVN